MCPSIVWSGLEHLELVSVSANHVWLSYLDQDSDASEEPIAVCLAFDAFQPRFPSTVQGSSPPAICRFWTSSSSPAATVVRLGKVGSGSLSPWKRHVHPLLRLAITGGTNSVHLNCTKKSRRLNCVQTTAFL